MPLTKATLVVREPTPPVALPVLFNPPEYELRTTNEYAEIGIPGLGSSLVQFVRGSAKTLSMELFFDTTDAGVDVRVFTSVIVGLTSVQSATHAPPRLVFVWGSLVFPCVLESVAERYLDFDQAGFPLRAQLTVQLRGDDLLESLLASAALESADRAKAHTVTGGDSLQAIAAAEYGDPRLWRPIALANGVTDPLRLAVGQVLTIPVLT